VARSAVDALDFAGIILGPLAFAALVYGISEGSTSWTATNTLGGIAVGALALMGFIVAELRVHAPLLELRVFRSPDFDFAILGLWAGQFALFGALFLVPLFLQQVRGYGALDTGFSLLPQALATMVFMPLGGALFDRIGARPLVVVGSLIMAAAGLLLGTVGITTRGWDLVLPLALYGAGMGLMLMSLNTQVLNAAPRALVGRVSALSTALLQVISSLAVAGLATVLSARTTTHTDATRAALSHLHYTSQSAALHAMQLAAGKAAATAFDDTFHVVASATVLAALVGLLLRRLGAHEAALDVESPMAEEAALLQVSA
jgi:MFS family permease